MGRTFAKPENQAAKMVSKALRLGSASHDRKGSGTVHSVGTARAYEQALKQAASWGLVQGFHGVKHWTNETGLKYLDYRSEQVGQKTLDLDRQALQILPKIDKLDRIKSTYEAEYSLAKIGRAYTVNQIKAIAESQSAKHALATEIAAAAGLRGHELHTLRLASERAASTHREWTSERFTGLEGDRYTVTGKGGLIREIVLPTRLTERLEATRHAEPVRVVDRGVHYEQHYNIGAGNRWSSSFTKVSNSTLGYSTGAHGVRHGYAQQRLEALQQRGFIYENALLIISQEMGHFRPDITEVYLR